MAAAGGRSIATGGAGWLRADGACGAWPEVMINRPCGGGAFAIAIILPEVTMTRSGLLRPGTVRGGRRHAAALAAAGVVVAACQVAAAGAATAGVSVASAAAQPAPCPPVPGQPSGGSPRIMIVGDSITQGSSGDYTWQYRLYEHLRADGVSPQMVGPDNWLFNNVTNAEG